MKSAKVKLKKYKSKIIPTDNSESNVQEELSDDTDELCEYESNSAINKFLYKQPSFENLDYVILDKYDGVQIKPLSIDHNVQVICSRMGTFKTKRLVEFINDYIDRFKSILFVTSKRSFASFIQSSIEPILPGKKVYNYLYDNIERQDYVIIQAESIHKLKKCYDLVVIDESTSFMKQMNSGLHRENLDINREKLEFLLQYATKIICMDADIDQRTIQFIHIIRPQDKIYYSLNTNKRGGYSVYWYNQKDEMLIWNKLDTLIDQGKNINIVVTSANYGRKLALHLQEKGVNYAFYFREQTLNKALTILQEEYDGQDINRLATVNDLWVRYQVVIFTSTITVGIDFNISHFHVQFVFGTYLSNNAREVKQMMGRVRNILDNTIYLYTISRKQIRPLTYERARQDFIKEMQLNEYICSKYLSSKDKRTLMIDGNFEYGITDNIWTWLTFNNIIEDNWSKCFYDDMINLMLINQGYQIHRFKLNEFDDSLFKEYKHTLSIKLTNEDIVLLDTAPIVNSHRLNEYKSRVEKGFADRQCIMTVIKNDILQHELVDEQAQITGQEIYSAKKYYKQLMNAKIECTKRVYDQVIYDISNKREHPKFTKYHYIKILCYILGVNNSLDRNTEIPCSRIRDNYGILLHYFDDIRTAFNLQCGPPTKFAEFKSFIDTVLKSWGGSILTANWNGKTHRTRNLTVLDYVNMLVDKYTIQNIDEFENIVPSFEYSDFVGKSYDTLVSTYTYKLKPPDEFFDIFLLRMTRKTTHNESLHDDFIEYVKNKLHTQESSNDILPERTLDITEDLEYANI